MVRNLQQKNGFTTSNCKAKLTTFQKLERELRKVQKAYLTACTTMDEMKKQHEQMGAMMQAHLEFMDAEQQRILISRIINIS